MREKIHPRQALSELLSRRRHANPSFRLVFTNGCFDLLHVGHLRYLWAARRLGEALVVAVNDDNSLRRLKGPERPILPLVERLQLLAGLACVDYVTWFDEDTPIPLLTELKPEILVKGANYSVDGVVGRREAQAWGAEVRTLALTPGKSSTNLIKKVLAMRVPPKN